MRYIKNKIFDEIKVGDSATLKRTLTRKDITHFAIMSGDVNPAHLDTEYAKKSQYHQVIAHGMWTASLISTVLGTELPGPGTIYLSQSLKFHRPVVVGDTITVKLTVIKKQLRKPVLVLACICLNQNKRFVLTGFSKVLAPIQKIKRKIIKLPHIVLSDDLKS